MSTLHVFILATITAVALAIPLSKLTSVLHDYIHLLMERENNRHEEHMKIIEHPKGPIYVEHEDSVACNGEAAIERAKRTTTEDGSNSNLVDAGRDLVSNTIKVLNKKNQS